MNSILIIGCDGDDRIHISRKVAVPAAIYGGLGDDEIAAGSGPDTIDAGDGDNRVKSGAGADTIVTGGGRDQIDAGDGNDYVRAGSGNDLVQGGDGDDILLGESGNDLMMGGDGRDLIIGGTGADRIGGNHDDDILIAGFTVYDNDSSALNEILLIWASNHNYAFRVASLTSGIAGPTSVRLNGDSGGAQTVFEDTDVDILAGAHGTDWFFANYQRDNGGPLDIVLDKTAKELWSDTDF